MQEKLTVAVQLKLHNRNAIYRQLALNEYRTKQQLMFDLKLSLPTVTQNLNDFSAEGLIEEKGSVSNTGGRNAVAYSIIPNARIAIGVDINVTHIAVVAVNIRGDILDSVHIHRHFQNSDAYFEDIAKLTAEMMEKVGAVKEKLLGIGVSVQGIVSPDRKKIVYGAVSDITGETVERICGKIPYPCELFHDSESAAFAELWISPEIVNAYHLSISTNLGGSLIINRELIHGPDFAAGTIEHSTLVAGGLDCYCGEKGCADAYLGLHTLTKGMGDGKLPTFFEMLANKDRDAVSRWDTFIENLTILINNLHTFIDAPVILGGYLAGYLDPHIATIKEKAYKRGSINKKNDYIRVGKFRNEAIAAGSALYYIDAFIRGI